MSGGELVDLQVAPHRRSLNETGRGCDGEPGERAHDEPCGADRGGREPTHARQDVQAQRPDVEGDRKMDEHRVRGTVDRLALEDLPERPRPRLARWRLI